MSTNDAGRARTARLSRERIVDAALAVADAEGVKAVSMRRIAAELGTGAMSLYNHVPDKDSLLDALAERVLAGVQVDTGRGWRAAAGSWATSLRASLLAHRSLVPVVVSAQRARMLFDVGRKLVEALMGAGLDEDRARSVMYITGRFVAGSVLFDAALMRRRGLPRAELDGRFTFGIETMLDGLAGGLLADVPATPAPAPDRERAPDREPEGLGNA